MALSPQTVEARPTGLKRALIDSCVAFAYLLLIDTEHNNGSDSDTEHNNGSDS